MNSVFLTGHARNKHGVYLSVLHITLFNWLLLLYCFNGSIPHFNHC